MKEPAVASLICCTNTVPAFPWRY